MCKRHRTPGELNHPSPPDNGSKITLIMAEGISVPWRNELDVFQASCFIKYFYSITLQLLGAVMGGCSSDLLLAPGLLCTGLDETQRSSEQGKILSTTKILSTIKSGTVISLAFREYSELFVILRRSPRGKLN